MPNYFNAEQKVYVTTDRAGFARTSRYLGDAWQDNAGHASPSTGFEERWHWQPPEQAPEPEPELPVPEDKDSFAYFGLFAIEKPVDGFAYVDCTCPTFTQITLPNGTYACEQLCNGTGQYESLAECLRQHPANPNNQQPGVPPGYDSSLKVVSATAGLPAGINYPDNEYGPCSLNTQGFWTAWTYAQPQPADVVSGSSETMFQAIVASGTLYTEDRGRPRIGTLPIPNGTSVDRWQPYGSPVVIDFTELGTDEPLREMLQTDAIMGRLVFDLNDEATGNTLRCVLRRDTWPTRVYAQGILGIAEGDWENCGGKARYAFTLPNTYPACYSAIVNESTLEQTIWCSWEVFTNSQTGAVSSPPTLPDYVQGLQEFWTSAECPASGIGTPYQPPQGQPPGKYDREYKNKELYYFHNGMAKPEFLKTINGTEPMRTIVSPKERQFVLTYGQKPQPFRQGPRNFCSAMHFSREPANAGLPVVTEAVNLLDKQDYVPVKIGKLNAFALAALTNASAVPLLLPLQINADEPWQVSLPDQSQIGFSVFMQNKMLSIVAPREAYYFEPPKPLTYALFEQDELFKPLFLGLKPFEAVSVPFEYPKNVLPPVKDGLKPDAELLAFGLDTSKKLKSLS